MFVGIVTVNLNQNNYKNNSSIIQAGEYPNLGLITLRKVFHKRGTLLLFPTSLFTCPQFVSAWDKIDIAILSSIEVNN